jgi:PAS domain S-box-containing protein
MHPDQGLLDELHRYAVFEPAAHALFGRAAAHAHRSLGAERIVVAIGGGQRLLMRAFDGTGTIVPAPELALVREVAHTRKAAAVEVLPESEAAGLSAHAWCLAVPLLTGNYCFGVLAALGVAPHRGRTDEDLEVLRTLGTWVSEVLDLQVEVVRRRRNETHLASQKEVLGMVARGAPLVEMMTALTSHVEHQAPGSLCAIRLRGGDGRIEIMASPTVPETMLEVPEHDPNDGLLSPSEAAMRGGALVVIGDSLEPCPLYPDFAARLDEHDLRACWIAPILVDGEAVGALEIYRSASGRPGPEDTELLSVATTIAGIAVERVRAEATLRRSEEHFRSLIENSTELTLVLDEAGSALYASPSAQRALGLDGQTAGFNDGLDPADHEPVAAALLALAETGGTASFDFRTARHLGCRYFSAVGSALLDNPAVHGIVVNARDVTERKEAEDALRRSEERYRLVSRSTNDVVWDWDVITGRIVWTDAIERVLGHPQVDTDAKWWEDRVHPADHEGTMASLRAALDGDAETWTREYRFLCGDDTYAMVVDRALIARDDEGTPSRVVGSMVDVTRRHELEEQLRQSQRMESIGRLAGGVAHDFNNLLTAMTGFVELLREQLEPDGGERLNFLDEISRAAGRASTLTSQLLAFSRRQILQPRALDPSAVVRGIVPMLRRLISENITIETELDPDTPWVWADLGQLEQVIVNLAVNARDAMPIGGSLTIGTSLEVVGGEDGPGSDIPAGSYVRITVDDTGLGIADDILPKIFEPFFTTKNPTHGTGLGLSTVYGIVKQSEGHIVPVSEVGRGTRFAIYLPPTAAVESRVEVREARGTEAASGRVLVVEDHDAVRDLARRILERKGYEVESVPDGAAALALLRANVFHPDLLLTDVVLLGMSGPEIAERVVDLVPGISVVFMSGYTDDHLGEHGIIDADVAFLQKPFTPQELLDVVGAVRNGRYPSEGASDDAHASSEMATT